MRGAAFRLAPRMCLLAKNTGIPSARWRGNRGHPLGCRRASGCRRLRLRIAAPLSGCPGLRFPDCVRGLRPAPLSGCPGLRPLSGCPGLRAASVCPELQVDVPNCASTGLPAREWVSRIARIAAPLSGCPGLRRPGLRPPSGCPELRVPTRLPAREWVSQTALASGCPRLRLGGCPGLRL